MSRIKIRVKWGLLTGGILLTILATWYVKSIIDKQAESHFKSECKEISININARLNIHAQILRDCAAFFRGSDTITRREWKYYTEQTKAMENMPGFQSIGFTQIVNKNKVESFSENIRKEGFPSFSIKPAFKRNFYTAVVFIEPFNDYNIKAFGYDMFTEKTRREAMERSRDYDIPALTGKVILLLEDNKRKIPGYLIYVPVYREESTNQTVDERRNSIKGWIYSRYGMSDFMTDILKDSTNREEFAIQVFDGNNLIPENELFSTTNTFGKNNHPVRFREQLAVSFYGHTWTLSFSKTGQSILSSVYISVWFVLFSGTVISILLFLFYNSIIYTRDKAQRIAEQLTAELRQSENFLNTIIDENPYAIWISDEHGTLIRMNKACTTLFGIQENEVIGKYNMFKDNIIEEQGFLPEIKKVFEKGEIAKFDIDYDGSQLKSFNFKKTRPIVSHAVVFPIIDEKGKVTNAIVQHMDITYRKKVELEILEKNLEIEAQNEEYRMLNEELHSAKERAEESDRLKSAFLQNMSHEIRTPMNAIMGFSELLPLYYNNKEKLDHFSKIINKRSKDLLDIINDILDLSKIESGQLPVKNEACSLNELFSELKDFFTEHRKNIGKKDLNIVIRLSSPDLVIVADRVKLKQILINLINNAFKFTEKGKIEVDYQIDSEPNILFSVSDTGIGIPPEKQSLIFDRFIQLEQKTNQSHGGTGLGLSIVKGLVNLLGGKIWLESQPHQGSTFYFSLPYKYSGSLYRKTPVVISKDNFDFSGKKILVVEDDFYNTEYLKEILTGTGLNITHTGFGYEAVQLASSNDPDIVLMDIRLPDMEGYEATRQILKIKPQMKIIAQTAYATQSDQQKALEAGCADYLSKPTRKEDLLTAIHRHLQETDI